jgi:dienelactone hydrolase
MSIIFHCHKCGKQFRTDEQNVGRKTKCTGCGAIVTVSRSPTAAPPPPPSFVTEDDDESGGEYGLRNDADSPRGNEFGAEPPALGPRYEEPSEPRRARPRRKSSGVPALVWWLGGGAAFLLLCCGGVIGVGVHFVSKFSKMVTGTPGQTISTAGSLAEARQGFQTQLLIQEPSWQEFDNVMPPGVERVNFQSGQLQLFGWFAKPAGDGPFPAVLHAHGGFALGDTDFEDVRPLLNAGFAVFAPAWRGENGNPGFHELYYGEVDDAAAALEYLAARPDIDATRLFATGHSAGGTIVMLLAEISPRLRGVMACGGAPDMQAFTDAFGQPMFDEAPYNFKNPLEGDLRSPGRHIRDLKCPLALYFSPGDDAMYLAQATALEPKARELGKQVTVESIPGTDHYTALAPAVQKAIAFFRSL